MAFPVHNFHKAGVATRGDFVLLSNMCMLFDSFQAQRKDSRTVNSAFPLKFGGHRWLKNVGVTKRTPTLWRDLNKYIKVHKEHGNYSATTIWWWQSKSSPLLLPWLSDHYCLKPKSEAYGFVFGERLNGMPEANRQSL